MNPGEGTETYRYQIYDVQQQKENQTWSETEKIQKILQDIFLSPKSIKYPTETFNRSRYAFFRRYAIF